MATKPTLEWNGWTLLSRRGQPILSVALPQRNPLSVTSRIFTSTWPRLLPRRSRRRSSRSSSRSKPTRYVAYHPRLDECHIVDAISRSASTAAPKIPPGHRCRSEFTCAWTVQRTTETWVCTSVSCEVQTSIVRVKFLSQTVPRLPGLACRMAMGPTTSHEDRRQRVCYEILPIQRR